MYKKVHLEETKISKVANTFRKFSIVKQWKRRISKSAIMPDVVITGFYCIPYFLWKVHIKYYVLYTIFPLKSTHQILCTVYHIPFEKYTSNIIYRIPYFLWKVHFKYYLLYTIFPLKSTHQILFTVYHISSERYTSNIIYMSNIRRHWFYYKVYCKAKVIDAKSTVCSNHLPCKHVTNFSLRRLRKFI